MHSRHHCFTQRFEHWLFHAFAIAPESLALYRIAFAAYILLFQVPSYVWIRANPDVFYNPPLSLASLFSRFPSYAVLQCFSMLVCLLFILLLFGYKTPVVSMLLTITQIVANSFQYAFGKIDHGILLVILPCVMAFSGWGTCLSVDAALAARSKRHASPPQAVEAWPIAFMALFLAFGFFSAGIPKLVAWVDFDMSTHGVRAWVMRAFFIHGRHEFLVPMFVEITNPYFWEMLDMMAVAFELGFIVALAFPKAFRVYIAIAVLFHFSNFLMLNIPFTGHMAVYLLFIKWEPILSYLRAKGVIETIRRLMRLRNMVIVAALYMPVYYAAQGIASMPSAMVSSPLLLLIEGWWGFNYHMVSSTIVLVTSVGVVSYCTLVTIREKLGCGAMRT